MRKDAALAIRGLLRNSVEIATVLSNPQSPSVTAPLGKGANGFRNDCRKKGLTSKNNYVKVLAEQRRSFEAVFCAAPNGAFYL